MSIVQRFSRNTVGRDFAVGDIHGCFSLLQAELDAIGFDPALDRLFSVGDLVDRGPESHLSIEWLERPWFHAVAGNHEDMAIRWPNGHMDAGHYTANGGAWNVANTQAERVQFSDAFSALPVAIELETEAGLVGIVHADCPLPSWHDFVGMLEDPELSNTRRRAVIDTAQWSRERIDNEFDEPVAGVRAVVVGHTPVQHACRLGNVLYIDTMGWRPGGHFSLLNLATLGIGGAE